MNDKTLKIIFKDWYPLLEEFLKDEYFESLIKYINSQYMIKDIYPLKKQIFRAFTETSWKNLKVVIIGQDPYFDGSGNGLAFANNEDKLILSPSLNIIKNNIEKTIYNNFKLDFDPTLKTWANQGVLLLNTALTVEKMKANSHKKQWFSFTKTIVEKINEYNSGIIFLLWGTNAKSYKKYIDLKKNYVFEHTHPAYAARNKILWECDHFKKVNNILEKNNGKNYKIIW